MAWQIPLSTSTGISLGTADDLLVLSNVSVAVTSGTAVRGTGVGHEVEVYGSVASTSDAIWLGGSTSTAANASVLVAEGAAVHSISSVGVAFWGTGNTLQNEGLISSKTTGALQWGDIAGTSTFNNEGTLNGDVRGIWHYGVDTLVLNNSGALTSKGTAYLGDGDGIDTITNTGRIVGNIELDGGNDTYTGTAGRLSGIVSAGAGNDTLRGGIDNDRFNGGADNDKLFGARGNDILNGDAGNDTLQGDDGNDTLNGGIGVDKLYGGLGKDTLTGGADKDTFIFKSIKESTVASSGRDVIKDFSRAQADKIDLSAIDANMTTSGNQAFKFIATDGFHKKAGELRYEIKSGDTFIHGDVNGDGKADFSIVLDLNLALRASDFLL